MDGVISIPVWLVAAAGFIAALTWIIMTHGRAPFAENEKPFENLMEVVGKPYVLIVFLASAALLIGAYVFYLNDIVISVHQMVRHLRSETAKNAIESDTLRNLAQGSALLLGALVAVSTLIFTLIRTWINERTTTATEEGLVTDRINAAVASLGAEKTKKDFETGKEYTVPNIEVRVGAILALERIAQNNADFHIQIMEILTAYLRENARIIPDSSEEDMRPDTQLAFSVIGRRSAKRIAFERNRKPHPYQLDLRFCDFRRVEGVGLNFNFALFDCSVFDNANLLGVQLHKANLRHTKLHKTLLKGASLTYTNFRHSLLSGTFLDDAILDHVDFSNAILDNVSIPARVQLKSISLQNAILRNQHLGFLRFENPKALATTYLTSSSVKNFDLAKIFLTQAQIDTVFGDGSVKLPKYLKRPEHWPDEELDWIDYRLAWREWRKKFPWANSS